MKGWWLALGWLLALSSVARAEGGAALRIELRAPDGAACTSAPALTERVVERVGRADAGEGVAVTVVIEAQGGGHRAQVTVRDASGQVLGQREIAEAGACTALDDTLTLVIASSVGVMTAEPSEPAAPEPPPPPLPAEPEPEPAPRAAEPPASAPPRFVSTPPSSGPEPPARWTFELELSGRGLTGVLPKPSASASLGGFAGHGDLGLSASASWLVPATLREDSELELHATGVWGELSACGRLAHAGLTAVWLCAGAHGGALRADAERLWRGHARWDALVQLVPSMRARIALASGFGLSLGCGADVPLVFPRYSYADAQGEVATYHEVELGVWAELGLWIGLN